MFGPQRIAALAGACALAFVGCGGGSGSSDATTVVEAGEPAAVDARDNTFRPEDISEWDRPCAETKDDAPDVADPSQLALVLWNSTENRLVGNDVSGSGLGDLAVGSISPDIAGLDNCFSGNTFTTTAPADLEALAPCDGAPTATDWSVGALNLGELIAAERPPSVDYQTAPLPDRWLQPNMPDAATAPARPATDGPDDVDVDAITVPDRPEGS